MANFVSDDKTSQYAAFGSEEVYSLDCVYCTSRVCDRGLKSFLIADEKVELYSTDSINNGWVILYRARETGSFQDRCSH